MFEGKDKSEILDSVEIHDYPLNAIDKAIDFVKKHSLKGYEIQEVRRKEVWSFPLVALREAVINAYAHMDYSQRGSPIRLSLFYDRIEVENPGLLTFGLTIKDILEGVSKARNKVIVRVMHELGFIEKWGSGISRMIKNCREMGLPDPEFREIGSHFRVILRTIPVTHPDLDKVDKAIIESIEVSEGMTTSELAAVLSLSPRATRDRLKRLVELKLIKEIGTSPFDPHKRYIL